MKLYEYESKAIFHSVGIPIPEGFATKNLDEALQFATKIGYPVVLKAQVLVGGRGKAGGVKIANNETEFREYFAQILSMRIKNEPVFNVLIEKKLDIAKELYLSVTVDRTRKGTLIIASSLGGVDIEEVAEKTPEAIIKEEINPIVGLMAHNIRYVTTKMGLTDKLQKKEFSEIIEKMWQIFIDYDCELVEINPLVLTSDGKLIAADAKIILDDNALFRHKEFEEKLKTRFAEYNEREIAAMESGMSYVELSGDIGIIGNGAGLVMATMDCVKHFGGEPANFLDVGGGASAERMQKALAIVSSHSSVKAIFINILGGITRCDEMAQGIVSAKQTLNHDIPLVIRLIGTNEEEGRKILTDNGINAFNDMESAAKKVVELVKEG